LVVLQRYEFVRLLGQVTRSTQGEGILVTLLLLFDGVHSRFRRHVALGDDVTMNPAPVAA
jgi:hypothetical protein